MVNVNHVIVGGRLTDDPKNIGSEDNPVAVFSLAINRKYRKKSTNEMIEETTFVDIKAFNGPAKTILQYVRKARSLLVEGRLQLEKWTASLDNSPRSKLRIIVESFHFLDYPSKIETSVVPITEAVPVDEVPVDEVPVDEVPVDEVPVDEVPVDEVSVDDFDLAF